MDKDILHEEEQAAELFKSKQDGKITFAERINEQVALLKDYDHKLFQQVIDGLVTVGWNEDGGSQTFRLLSRDEASIKVFRDAKVPAVIKVCFGAEPEEDDEKKENSS